MAVIEILQVTNNLFIINPFIFLSFMKTFLVTGTIHGCFIYASCQEDARRAFNRKYNGEKIIHIKCYNRIINP